MKLYEYIDKQVRVTLKDGQSLRGKCIDYTKAIENDPEIESIDLMIKKDIFEIYENEIEVIEIIKKHESRNPK